MRFLSIDNINNKYIRILQHLLTLHSDEDYQKIMDILGIKEDIYEITARTNDKIVNKYYLDKGMIFLDSEPIVIPRIFVDNFVDKIIDSIFVITENIISNQKIFKIILDRFITNSPKDYLEIDKLDLDKNNSTNSKQISSLDKLDLDKNNRTYKSIRIYENSWNKFKMICKTSNLNVEDAFKYAIYDYLDSLQIDFSDS